MIWGCESYLFCLLTLSNQSWHNLYFSRQIYLRVDTLPQAHLNLVPIRWRISVDIFINKIIFIVTWKWRCNILVHGKFFKDIFYTFERVILTMQSLVNYCELPVWDWNCYKLTDLLLIRLYLLVLPSFQNLGRNISHTLILQLKFAPFRERQNWRTDCIAAVLNAELSTIFPNALIKRPNDFLKLGDLKFPKNSGQPLTSELLPFFTMNFS